MDGRVHDDIAELLPGYALGALDADEARRVGAHLDDCPSCRLELEDLVEAANVLAFAAPPARPSPAAKRALFARLAEDGAREASPAAAPAPDPPTPQGRLASPDGRGGALPQAGAPRRSRLWPRLFGGGGRGGFAFGVLALLLVLALGGWNLALQRRLNEQQKIVRLLENPAAAHTLSAATAPGDDYGGGSRTAGFVYADPGGDVALMLAYWMPALQPGQRYQIWLITPDNQRESGGLFTVDANGNAQVLIHAPAPFAKYRAVGVTAEPWDGSPGPTSPPVMRGNLQ